MYYFNVEIINSILFLKTIDWTIYIGFCVRLDYIYLIRHVYKTKFDGERYTKTTFLRIILI